MRELTLVALLVLVVSVVSAGGCASTSEQVVRSYRKHLKGREWQAALAVARGQEFYGGKKSRLLKAMELAMVHHLQGRYLEAQRHWDQSVALSEELFTVSVAKKVLKGVGSDSLDIFYAQIYERSLLWFYSALNHYLLYQYGGDRSLAQGPPVLSLRKRRRHLGAARAMVVGWNAKIKQWRVERLGKTVYKDDLLAKIFGAFIHLQVARGNDLEIAQLLYQDAKRVLWQNYNAYPSFNHRYQEFRRNFKQLPQLSRTQVLQGYVTPSARALELEKFLRQAAGKSPPPNVTVLVHHGLVAPMRAKKYYLPLNLVSAVKVVVTGEMSIVDFALRVLGLTSPSGVPAIVFELPEVVVKGVAPAFSLGISSGERQVALAPLVLVNPISEMAWEAVEEHALATRVRLGGRLVVKHGAAMASAYAAYRASLKSGVSDAAARLVALGLYSMASKGIALSERADLRHWSSLPHRISIATVALPAGNYRAVLLKSSGERVLELSEFRVPAKGSHLVSVRAFRGEE